MERWLTMLAAFVCAVLSGMGVGSAGLFVLYLTLWAGMAQTEAQALNLLFFLLSAGASLLLHTRNRQIPWRLTGFLLLCALPGAFLGTYLVRVLDASLVRRLFGGMLVLVGAKELLGERRKKEPARQESARQKSARQESARNGTPDKKNTPHT